MLLQRIARSPSAAAIACRCKSRLASTRTSDILQRRRGGGQAGTGRTRKSHKETTAPGREPKLPHRKRQLGARQIRFERNAAGAEPSPFMEADLVFDAREAWRDSTEEAEEPAPFEAEEYRFEDTDASTIAVPCPDIDGFMLTETHDIVLRAPVPMTERPARTQEVKETFRSMAPYIATHRGKTVVIHVPGEAIDGQCANFPALVQDIILMHTLGIKIVLVAGCRPQINERMIKAGRNPVSMLDDHLMRRTDAFTLRCVREASSYARVYLESQVGRGLVDASYSTGFVQVSSGNFVTARPYDNDTEDFGYAGKVDKINIRRINQLLECNDVVLIGCLGYTTTGEVYNCSSEEVALQSAVQLGAHKLIYLYDGHELRDRNTGGIVHSIPFSAGHKFLTEFRKKRAGEAERHEKDRDREAEDKELRKETELLMYMQLAVDACAQGVPRSHLIQRQEDGSLLLELFTRDGGGLMISRDLYDGIRPARPVDTDTLIRLITPLVDKGILVRRSRETIDNAIAAGEFTVVERDGTVIACATLTQYPDDDPSVKTTWAEIGCIAVHPSSRNLGKGNALVGFLLRRANNLGCSNVFALTTQTAHWFIERGFHQATLDDIPKAKRDMVDRSRNSRVYVMRLQGTRQLDELELLTGGV